MPAPRGPRAAGHDTPHRGDPRAIAVALPETLRPRDIPILCARLQARLCETAARTFVCDLGALAEADLVAIDALARLQLTARRFGCQMRLSDPPDVLAGLLELTGLCDVISASDDLPVESEGQPEHRIEPLRVEKESDPGDAVTGDLEDL